MHPWIFHFFFKIDPWKFDSFIFNTSGNWAIPEKIQTEGSGWRWGGRGGGLGEDME